MESSAYSQNPDEVYRRQVPLRYLLHALGHESKEDVVMKLGPMESEEFVLPLEQPCAGTRFGSPLEHSGVFAALLLVRPDLFECADAALDPAAAARDWLENAVYLIPDVCTKAAPVLEAKPAEDGTPRTRRGRTLLKSQAHVRALFKNKSFHEDDFFLFMAFCFDTQIAIYDVVQRTSVLYNSLNRERSIVLLNVNGQFEAWRPSAGPPNFRGAREHNRVPASRAVPASGRRGPA